MGTGGPEEGREKGIAGGKEEIVKRIVGGRAGGMQTEAKGGARVCIGSRRVEQGEGSAQPGGQLDDCRPEPTERQPRSCRE